MSDINLLENQPIAWTPSPEVIERAQLTRFMRQVGVLTWEELYEFSIRDVEKFTEEVLKFLDIRFDPPYEKLLDTSGGIEFPHWFERSPKRSADTPVRIGGSSAENSSESRSDIDKDNSVPFTLKPDDPSPTAVSEAANSSERRSGVHTDKSVRAPAGLNITTMCLDRWQTDEFRDRSALVAESEDDEPQELTFGELLEEVEEVSEGLRLLGFGKGDAIGIHLPMIVETVVALLAINRIGAIAVPVFSGYGVEAISSRLKAVQARAVFTCEGFSRRGKLFDAFQVAQEAVENCPSIEKIIVVERMVGLEWTPDERVADNERAIFYHELTDSAYESPRDEWPAELTSAEDPLIILYTSGTTGKPKGIAHTHASFPIKAAQDMAFGTDVGRGTRICWYTDIGWMMGPWLIYGALINGATICIYDGAPDYPTPDRMWEFCARHKVEVLGISPTLVRALAASENAERSADTPVRTGGSSAEQYSERQSGVHADKSVRAPHERHDLSSLRAFASTGEPWNPAPWWWLFDKVGNSKLPIINYSGGTEIAGGILMGNPLLPIKPCSFPAPCPGMDVDILDENGNPVGPNQVGELVIKQPWIGMARGFWQDNERYLETYWSRFKGIWVHGDWAMRDSDGDWFILGRSDDTLKVAGKRVGPAEVESLLVAHPLVTEAAVIGVPDEVKGTAMVAFVVLSADTPKRSSDTPKGISDTPVRMDATSASRKTLGGGTADADKSVRAPLEAELKALVAKDMGKPLAPSKIHFVSALPKTRNAKVMRRVIRAAYLGEDPGDLSALENPTTVKEIAELEHV